MAVFPPEVLAEICQHFENDKDTLRALRLVNQFLGVEASKYLYKTLLVYQTHRSWKKLHFISQCQHLNHYTEELELATLEYLPVYADFEAWKLATSEARLVTQRLSNSLAGATAVMSEVDRYRSYCNWQHGEQKLLNAMESDGGALAFLRQSIGVITFPNLHTVKSLGAHELWPSTPQGPTNRRERETAVVESLKPNTKTCKRMSAHLCFALEVFHLSGPLGSNIVSLEFHRYREILVEQTFNIPALRELQNLTLSFPSGPEEEIYSKMWGPVRTDKHSPCIHHAPFTSYSDPQDILVSKVLHDYEHIHPETIFKLKHTADYRILQWKLAHWLRDAQELKTLKILTQDLDNWPCNAYRNVIRLFNDATWPKLRIIHFNETFVTSLYLLPFLKKHVDNLESLCIEDPIVKLIDWQWIADKIRMMFSATTCHLILTDPHPAAEDEIYLDDNDDNSFFTPELHPDFDELDWEDRHLYRDLLGED